MTNKMKSKEIIVEVTEEEYQADLDNGLHEDEVLKPGTHTFKRGGFLARHNMSEQTSSLAKVRISINLDEDVLNYFKQRAAQPNAAAYQTQINNTLREVMEKEQSSNTSLVAKQAEALLADPRFIDAIAERVHARRSATRKRSGRASAQQTAQT